MVSYYIGKNEELLLLDKPCHVCEGRNSNLRGIDKGQIEIVLQKLAEEPTRASFNLKVKYENYPASFFEVIIQNSHRLH